VEAADAREAMTCRKYGWSSSGDSTQLIYSNKRAVQQQQQQQHPEDAAAGTDATCDDDEQLRQNRYKIYKIQRSFNSIGHL